MKMRHSTFEFNVKSVVSDKHYFRPSGGGFLRHGRIYHPVSILPFRRVPQFDHGTRLHTHRLNEFGLDNPLTGCSPAVPVSVLPSTFDSMMISLGDATVADSSALGGLIHTSLGGLSGIGHFPLKRFGLASKAAFKVAARA